MENKFRTIADRFALDAPAARCERYGCGHINETYLLTTVSGRRYILQKINHHGRINQFCITQIQHLIHNQQSCILLHRCRFHLLKQRRISSLCLHFFFRCHQKRKSKMMFFHQYCNIRNLP